MDSIVVDYGVEYNVGRRSNAGIVTHLVVVGSVACHQEGLPSIGVGSERQPTRLNIHKRLLSGKDRLASNTVPVLHKNTTIHTTLLYALYSISHVRKW